MLLLINGDRLVKEVQQDFSQAYPYLKIEFFKTNGAHRKQALKEDQIKHDQKLKLAKGRDVVKGQLLVEDNMSVADLEKEFMNKFGLRTQVFRRSGNIWLEASLTESWSLQQQNALGKEISMGRTAYDKNREEEDYDLNRDAG